MQKLSFNKKLSNVQIRDAGDGRLHITGIIPYNSISEDLGGYREIILPSAFTKTLKDGSEVYALANHNTDCVLGNTRNQTLVLTSGPDGLLCEATLPTTSYAQDVYNLIKDDYVNGMSFGFQTIQHEWDGDDPKNPIDSIIEAKLIEVSYIVAFPAYAEAGSVARNLRNINFERMQDILNKENINSNDEVVLRTILKQITSSISDSEPITKAAESTDADATLFLTKLKNSL